jgi:hypothetical protein
VSANINGPQECDVTRHRWAGFEFSWTDGDLTVMTFNIPSVSLSAQGVVP